jgi:hypothetical protein
LNFPENNSGGVYFEGQHRDTLLAGKVAVDLGMLQLLSNNVIINSVDLNGITANINRNVKGTFLIT